MGKIFNSLLELVGKTPLLSVNNLTQELKLQARILVKLESYNPIRSVKDRAALAMIEAAEAVGKLGEGSTIVEASSGNTGLGIAFVAKLKGYRAVIVMPESMSIERRRTITALGAELVLSPASEGMKGAMKIAEEIIAKTPKSISLGQFDNPANPNIHEKTTAEEIWLDTDGQVDAVVAGVGTGGTITGLARGLKAHKAEIKAIAVQPNLSPVLTGGQPAPHMIQGIGAGFVPQNYDASLIDEVISISNEDAIAGARLLASSEGVLAGFSSGAALSAAVELARRPEYAGKTIVAILPDTGERYLSTSLYDETFA